MKSSNYKVSVLSLEQLLTGCGEAVLRPAGKAPTVEEHGLSSMPGTSPAGPSMDFDRAADRVHYAAKLDNAPVASALDDAAAMDGDRWINEIAAQTPKARKRAVLVRAGEPAVADHIVDKDRRQLADFSHRWPSGSGLIQTAVRTPRRALPARRLAMIGDLAWRILSVRARLKANGFASGVIGARDRPVPERQRYPRHRQERRGSTRKSVETTVVSRV